MIDPLRLRLCHNMVMAMIATTARMLMITLATTVFRFEMLVLLPRCVGSPALSRLFASTFSGTSSSAVLLRMVLLEVLGSTVPRVVSWAGAGCVVCGGSGGSSDASNAGVGGAVAVVDEVIVVDSVVVVDGAMLAENACVVRVVVSVAVVEAVTVDVDVDGDGAGAVDAGGCVVLFTLSSVIVVVTEMVLLVE